MSFCRLAGTDGILLGVSGRVRLKSFVMPANIPTNAASHPRGISPADKLGTGCLAQIPWPGNRIPGRRVRIWC
jgi:hypothetical protein